ncbi:MAG: aldolase [Acidobacteriota bacterium]|nr:aldolase [Acidobacteriota bacterium]
MRHNRMISLLAEGRTVFGLFADNRSPDGAAGIVRNDQLDFVFYDMEHSPLDVTELRTWLQFTIDPAAILRRGRPGTDHPVLARIPAYGREMNHWMVKQVLDQGVHGVIVPHIETAEQALSLVRAMRYPHAPGTPDAEPAGQRGAGPFTACRLWGLSLMDYLRAADVWPLDPDGELVSMALIENPLGVRHASAIARTPGLSVVVAAPGDLSVSYAWDRDATEQAIQTVLAAAKDAGVPCGITAGQQEIVRRVEQGFRVIMATDPEALVLGRRAAGR